MWRYRITDRNTGLSFEVDAANARVALKRWADNLPPFVNIPGETFELPLSITTVSRLKRINRGTPPRESRNILWLGEIPPGWHLSGPGGPVSHRDQALGGL